MQASLAICWRDQVERGSRNTGEANLDFPAPAEPPPDSSDLFWGGLLMLQPLKEQLTTLSYALLPQVLSLSSTKLTQVQLIIFPV